MKGFTTPSKGDLIPDVSSSINMKKPYPPTPVETPRVTHGDLDNLIGRFCRAKEVLTLTPFPDVCSKLAESVLPHQVSLAPFLSRPDTSAGATVLPLEPNIP